MSERPSHEGGEQFEERAENGERQPETGPRIYVASLSDYNAGRLHGEWIEADQPIEEIQAQVQAMLAASPEPIAEEWAIHDFEGFGPWQLGEYEDLAVVARIATGIAEHGEAFAAWAHTLEQPTLDGLDGFEDAYHGSWSSLSDYAESLLEDLGVDVDALGPENLQPYVHFDLDAFARDLAMDLFVVDGRDGVHVFES